MAEIVKELVQEIVKLTRQNDKLEEAYKQLQVKYDELEQMYKREHEQSVRFHKMIREDVVVSGIDIEEMINKTREAMNILPEVVESEEDVNDTEEKQDATASAVAPPVNTDVNSSVNNVNSDVKQVEVTTDKQYKTSSSRREYMRKYMNERREKK
jgi:predicted nuclease with TOPRIM domain